jgi:hypothetical protein
MDRNSIINCSDKYVFLDVFPFYFSRIFMIGDENMTKKTTNDEYLARVFELVGEEYTILEGYIDTRTKILTVHNTCGYEWKISPNKFLIGRRCPKCSRKAVGNARRLTLEEVKEKIFSEFGGSLELFGGEYVSNLSILKIRCMNCGKIFERNLSNLIGSKGCSTCFYSDNPRHNKKSQEIFEQELFEKYGEEYVILGEYVDCKTHILLRHFCGNEWSVTPSNILRGYGCPICGIKKRSDKVRKPLSVFMDEIEKFAKGEYTILSEYKNNHTKITLKHSVCDSIIEILPENFLKRKGCPVCRNKSLGEKRIKVFLENMNIDFLQQYKFKNCRGLRGGQLRFDFGILKDDVLLCLIEYQGIGHFLPIEYFGGQEVYLERKSNDAFKGYYCYKRDIPLISISYLDYNNIEKILEEALSFILEGR